MNPLGLKAGILAAAAFVLLVPTFNALNAAHFEEVDPPFNLEPPDDPPDVDDPPLGDRDIELNGAPPPGSAGACEEYDIRDELLYSTNFTATPGTLLAPGSNGEAKQIQLPPNVLSLGVAVYLENYVGDFIIVISDPQTTQNNGPADQRLASTTDGPKNVEKEYPFPAPSPGTWTIDWTSEQEVMGGGTVVAAMQVAECRTPGAAPE